MPEYQISLEIGKTWTRAWRNRNPQMIKAFRIDSEEINQILALHGASYVRAYMGYDVVNNIEKLILVAVDSEGRDIIDTDPNRNSNVFDFTLPCPSICDAESPLNS